MGTQQPNPKQRHFVTDSEELVYGYDYIVDVHRVRNVGVPIFFLICVYPQQMNDVSMTAIA